MFTSSYSRHSMRIVGVLLSSVSVVVLANVAGSAAPHSHSPAMTPSASANNLISSPVSSLYTCSMHPHIRSDNPHDRCPICGMALIPVTQGDAAAADAGTELLRLSARANALLQPELTPVRRQQAETNVSLVGTLAVDQRQLKTISAWASGRIEQLYLNSTAIDVQVGQPMAALFSPEVIVIQQELVQAKQLFKQQDRASAGHALARTNLQSAQRRLRLLGMPNEQIQTILNSEVLLDTVTISAPVAGVVMEKLVNTGAYVTTGQPLFTVLNLETVWLELEAFEHQLPFISAGQPLTVKLVGLPNEQRHAEVLLLEPVVDASRRTVRVRALLDNADGRLKPGMLATAELKFTQEGVLLIPVSAALLTGKRALVYVRLDDERPTYSSREVVLGRRFGSQYEVLSGLTEQDLVVSRGVMRLDSERQIRGLSSMMASASHGGVQGHHHGAQAVDDSLSDVRSLQLSAHEQTRLLDAYRVLYNALTEDDLSRWQQGAAAFNHAVAVIDWPLSFKDSVDALTLGVNHGHSAASLADARDAFYTQVQVLLALADEGVLAGGWSRAYCPMARDGQGASWLQPQKNVLNPYYGSMMLRCGDLERTYPIGGDHAN